MIDIFPISFNEANLRSPVTWQIIFSAAYLEQMPLTIVRYKTVQDFIQETGSTLEKHELENTFIWLACKTLSKQGDLGSSYCGTVWDEDEHGTRQHVISIAALHTLYMYPSSPKGVKQAEIQAAIEMLVKDALQTLLEIKYPRERA
ncbi:hypothetical protein VTP01DRAFT_6428, partial [Rhizomucor pusillus]|uniref:uncharacterized protein n=1 Tax=Rhizomucor pusillus TaxID=4840 RepID=UPI0037434587